MRYQTSQPSACPVFTVPAFTGRVNPLTSASFHSQMSHMSDDESPKVQRVITLKLVVTEAPLTALTVSQHIIGEGLSPRE